MKHMNWKKSVKSLGMLLAVVLLLSVMLAGCSQQKAAAPPKDEAYPTKPLQNIVSWAAGGSSDMSQRMVASFIGKYFGQSMVIINKSGGAAVPGTVEISKSPKDGYTIGMNWYASFVLRPYLLDVPYKMDDFTFILGMARQRNTIAVKADSPFKTLQDLVDYAKKNPKKLKFSGSPTASWQHLAGMDFNRKAGIETQFVPFDGGRPSAIALLGGHIDYIVGQPMEFAGELKEGSIRCLAALETTRIPDFPSVPTATELGFPVAHPHMMIIVGPAGMPPDRVKKIHDAYKAVLEDKDFLKIAKDMGLEIEYKSGEAIKKEMQELAPIYQKLVAEVVKK